MWAKPDSELRDFPQMSDQRWIEVPGEDLYPFKRKVIFNWDNQDQWKTRAESSK